MSASPQIADRLAELVRRRNRELLGDAALKAALGVGFSLLTFGFIYWGGWLFGFFVARGLGLAGWQFGLLAAALFFVAATFSAWRRVDPLADLQPLTDEQWLAMAVGQVVGVVVFSPRHAVAGAAIVLIGGPAGMIEAFGIWAHRLRADRPLLTEAARLLASCAEDGPISTLQRADAAQMLWRLGLIRVVARGESPALQLSDKGHALLGKAGKRKRPSQ